MNIIIYNSSIMAVILKLLLVVLVIKFVQCDDPPVNVLAQMKNLLSFAWKKFEDRPQGFFSRLRQESVSNQFKDAYDYVIVGASPSGCVLANRLSEDPTVKVLLIEAGEKVKAKISNESPMSAPNLQRTDYNWNYETETQKNACLGMDDHKCNFPHGKGLGGSSILNYLIYTRGNKRDFDNLEQAGIYGWSYKDVLPFFKKSEKSYLHYSSRASHGQEGELPVEDIPYRTKIAESFVKSAIDSGYNYVDYNGVQQIGVSYVQSNTKNGWRVDAAEAFLAPIKNRKNLDIITEATAFKISINKVQKTAKSVLFFHNEKKHEVKANREIILSAGAFESPKLLMLSGVGPAQDLRKLGIEVVQDLPVGKEMYEHVGVFGPIFTIDEIDEFTDIKKIFNVKNMGQFFLGRGPFTMNGIESLMYFKTNLSEVEDPGMPDIEVMQSFATLAFDTIYGGNQNVRMSDETYDAVFKPLENKRAFQFLPMLLHPKSKGSLKLKSKNPIDKPILNPNYFDNDQDLETLVAGIKEIIRVASSKQFNSINAKLYEVDIPGCDFVFNTDDYWKCYAKTLTATFHHQVATTKMGPVWDKFAIVDERLRVNGIKNLRVADIGIIPQPVSGHTSAFSFMIGEKAAAMIQQDWSNKISKYEGQVLPYSSRLPYLLKGSSRVKRELSKQESTTKKKVFDWQFNHRLDESKEVLEEFQQDRNRSKIVLKGNRNDPNIIVLQKLTAEQIPTNSSGDDPKYRKQHFSVILHPTLEEEEYKKALSRLKLLAHHHHIHHEHFRSRQIVTTTESVKSSTTTEKSHIDIIVDSLPSEDEDKIKTLILNGTSYGNGLAQPRVVSEILQHMNATEYKEDVEAKNRGTTSVEITTKSMKTHKSADLNKPDNNTMPNKIEIRVFMVSSSESNTSETSTKTQSTTTEETKIQSSHQISSTTTENPRPKRTVEEFERFGQAGKIFTDGYKNLKADIMTSNKHYEDFATSFEKFARSKRSTPKEFTEMVTMFGQELKHFDEHSPELHDKFIEFVESLNKIPKTRRKRSFHETNALDELSDVTNTFSEKLSKFNDDVVIAGNDFKGFMSALYKFSEMKEQLLKRKSLSSEEKERLHQMTQVFEKGFQSFNEEILEMGDHLVGLFASVEKFSRMKRDVSVVTLKPVEVSSNSPSKIEQFFGKSWENIKNATSKTSHYLKSVVHPDNSKAETTTKSDTEKVIHFSKTKRDVDSSTTTTNTSSEFDESLISKTSNILKEETPATTTKKYYGRSWFHHDIQEPKIRNLYDYKAKRDLPSSTHKPEISSTESSSKIGKFFESSWGSIRNGTAKVTNYIKEKVSPDNDVQKIETTTKFH